MHASLPRAPLLAWLGGAVFVASLGFFVWTFFDRFGRVPADGPRVWPVLVDLALFGGFALHHSVLARSGAKRWLMRRVPAHLERSLYVWVASLLFVAVCALWRDVPGAAYRHAGLWAVPHWIAVGLGAWLIMRSTGVIDPLDLAGIRQASRAQTPPGFRVVGPYHLVRHPIYLGWLLLVFGVPHMTATRLAFAAISSAYLVVAIPFEERSLIETFGDEYRRYQQLVRWRLIPGVW
jgi:protein-S-isoprenylcysteine O-methyltransferase Ste14